MYWYFEVLKKYAVFSGRARRKEYWTFNLFNIIIYFMALLVDSLGGMGVFVTLYSFAVTIPSIAVGVRRLHDTNRRGWWLLISLVPLIGGLIVLIILSQDSQPGDNQYGPNPSGTIKVRDEDDITST